MPRARFSVQQTSAPAPSCQSAGRPICIYEDPPRACVDHRCRWLGRPIALLSLVVTCVPAAAAPGVDPQTFSATLVEGTNVSVSKTVHTLTIPPTPDIIFLSDTTGSMGGVIAGVQEHVTSVANQILAAQPQAQ